MEKNTRKFLALTLAASLCACASLPTGTYTLAQSNASVDQTALIRPTKEEERQYKPSAVARVFSGPAGIAQLLHIWPANDLDSGTPVRQFESVRVSPGSYLVKVNCNVGGYSVHYDLPVKVSAGNEYLIECTGYNVNSSDITVREVAPTSET